MTTLTEAICGGSKVKAHKVDGRWLIFDECPLPAHTSSELLKAWLGDVRAVPVGGLVLDTDANGNIRAVPPGLTPTVMPDGTGNPAVHLAVPIVPGEEEEGCGPTVKTDTSLVKNWGGNSWHPLITTGPPTSPDLFYGK